MNAVLQAMLRLLDSCAEVSVDRLVRSRGTVVVELSRCDRVAMLVAADGAPPVTRDASGRRSYGAYVILDQGYGDLGQGG